MKNNTKKILALSVLGLFMFAFAISFVAAANPIGDWFTAWEDGEKFSAGIAKYFFWALVSMLIYGISDKFPGLSGKEYIKVPFSLVVGFLSMAYVTPDEVIAMMTGYSALGFTFGVVIPLFILVFFTFDIAAKNGTPSERVAYQIIATLMWVFFAGFMVVRAFSMGSDASGTTLWLTWIVTIAAVILAFSLRPIMRYMKGEIQKTRLDTLREAGELISGSDVSSITQANAAIDAASKPK